MRLLLLPGLMRPEWSRGHLWGLPIAFLVLTYPEGPLGLYLSWVLARACWRGCPRGSLLPDGKDICSCLTPQNLLHPSLTAGGWTSGKKLQVERLKGDGRT